jgi:hypothetical protein
VHWDGASFSEEILRRDLSEHLSDEMVDVLADSLQMTLIDEEWGRQDLLWDLLGDFLDGLGQSRT